MSTALDKPYLPTDQRASEITACQNVLLGSTMCTYLLELQSRTVSFNFVSALTVKYLFTLKMGTKTGLAP